MVYFISFIVVVLTVLGQLLLKHGSGLMCKTSFVNPYIVTGYSLFVIVIPLSYYLMSLIPMKNFTIIMTVNYVAVMFLSSFFLKDKLSRNKITGTFFVVIGIVIFVS